MHSIDISLAGKIYTIEKLPIRANREWRQRFDAPIATLMGAARAIKEVADTEFETTAEMMKVVGVVLIKHLDQLVAVLLESIDLITDAVFAYSPALEADKEYIETHGFDDEIVKAFIEIVQVAYPFGSVIQSMTALGSQVDGTSPSSLEQNGDSGKTSSMK